MKVTKKTHYYIELSDIESDYLGRVLKSYKPQVDYQDNFAGDIELFQSMLVKELER